MGRQGNSTSGENRAPAKKAPINRAPSNKASAKSGARAVRQPVSAVFRRRRLLVGGAVLMVLAMALGGFAVATGAFSGGSEQASSTESGPQPQPGGTTGTAPAPAPTSTPAATPTCDQNLVTVSASTDKAAYGADEKPLLSLKVTNGGQLPCDVNIGTSQMEFLVTSGSDRIFSSGDCQAKSEDLVKTIQPGKSESANFPWPRNRTVEGCQAIGAKPGAGGAYYVFVAKLGSKSSPKAVFQLS
ncbi:hypothetical protein [Pseudarthrobacter sp. N5]|uniref:hypothetical protein n=1 Tax=Pseudarthrobacter sp. N5 TaxID=3418416 RepID=UPI003CEF52F4